MKCHKCNLEVADDAQFCNNCGTNLIQNNITKQENNNDTAIIQTMGTIVVLLLFLVIIPLMSNSDSEEVQEYLWGIIAIIILIISAIFCSKIKNIVLKVARWLLDFSTTVDVLTGFTILISGIFICKDTGVNYWWFVLGAFLYSLIALVKDYALYLLIDIRDSLKILSNKVKSEKDV